MAQFFALTPLNAANFESGAATEGQVLTADGAGGAAFEDAAGGASFAFDGATFDIGEMVDDEEGTAYYPFGLVLTSGGTPITEDVQFIITTSSVMPDSSKQYFQSSPAAEISDEMSMTASFAIMDDNGSKSGYMWRYLHESEMAGTFYIAYGDNFMKFSLGEWTFYMNILLPSGKIASSPAMTYTVS